MITGVTLPDLTRRRAELTPDRIAIIDTGTGLEFTYSDLEARASALAVWLRDEWRIAAGDRVAVIAMNGAPTLELLFACAKAGALLVPLNWRLAVAELVDVLRDCAPRALVYGAEFADAAQALVRTVGIEFSLPLQGDSDHSYVHVVESGDGKSVVMPDRDHDHPWGLLYTSGTTGRAKGVIQTFGMVLANHLNCGVAIGLTDADTTLNVLPQFHTAGLNLYTLPTLIAGGTAIVQRRFDPSETIRLLERATAFVGVPAMYRALEEHPDFDHADFSKMRSWGSGGAPMSAATIQRLANRGILIQQSFGMTETGPTICLMDRDHAVTKAGSVGKPQLFVETKIVGIDGDVLAGRSRDGRASGPGPRRHAGLLEPASIDE